MEQSNHYLKRYGAWAGNPKGHAPDYSQCAHQVHENVRGGLWHQCRKARGHGPDGAFCSQHDPAKAQARREKALQKAQAQFKERLYGIYGKRFFDALKQIADGHNDPRTLAKTTIRVMEKD